MMAIENSNYLTPEMDLERKPLVKQASSRTRRPKMKRSVSSMKKQFRYRKPICPFIASTFLDFQAERDILVKKVFPAIDALCRDRGAYCAPIDLRWGINDTQVNSGLVIQSCLDYVKQCSPFFLCLMGERYGSHRPNEAPPLPKSYSDLPADADWLDRNFLVAASGGYDWVLQDSYQHCSVTELEIIQAAFLGESDMAHFYFRTADHIDNLFTDLPESERRERLKLFEPEDKSSHQKLGNLKTKIVNQGLRVKYFKTPVDLAKIVLEDWTRIVNRLYPPLEDMVYELYADNFAEWMAHETYAETRRRAFVKSSEIDEIFQKLTNFALTALDEHEELDSQVSKREMFAMQKFNAKKTVQAKYQSILTLVGDNGCGKTTIVANWIKQFSEENPNITVFCHYVGSSSVSVDIGHLLRRCAQEVRGDYQPPGSCDESDPGSAEEMCDFNHITESFKAAIAMGPCVLVIAGISELAASCGYSAQQVKELYWIPQTLPPNCKVVFTTKNGDSTCKILSQRADNQTIAVPPVNDLDTRRQVIKEHLAMHCKALDASQLERIVNCKHSERPLFLTVLANELRVFGVYSKLDYHLDSYLEASGIRDLWGQIIKRWIKDYSWSTNRNEGTNDSSEIELVGWVADALRLIAVSRNGLSQSEILGALEQIGYQGNSRVSSLDWALFRSAALDALFERPGALITFFHRHFKAAVEHTLLGAVTPESEPIPGSDNKLLALQRGSPNRGQYHSYLANYFKRQPHSDRRCEELPWHLHMCGDYEQLCEVLTEPRLFMEFQSECGSMGCKRLDLLRYWTCLKAAKFDPCEAYASVVYSFFEKDIAVSPSDDCGAFEKNETSMTKTDESTVTMETNLAAATSGKETRDIDALTSAEDKNKSAIKDVIEHKAEDQGMIDDRRSSVTSTSSGKSTISMAHKSIDIAQLASCIGQFLAELGYFAESERVLLRGHKKLEEIYPLDDDQQWLLCVVQENLANMYLYQLKKGQAFKWYTKALDTVETLIERVEVDDFCKYVEAKGRILDHMGNMKTHDRSYKEAEEMLRRAEKCMGECCSYLGKATVHHHLGILRMRQRKFLEAETFFRDALSARERWYGMCHPHVAEVLNDLAGLLCFPGNTDSYDKIEAEVLYVRAMNIREQSLGHDHLLLATTLFHLGRVKAKENSVPAKKEALSYLRRSLVIRTQKLGADHNITRAVRKIITETEAELRSKSFPTNRQERAGDRAPYSSLSWHDHELMNMLKSNSKQPAPKPVTKSVTKPPMPKPVPVVGVVLPSGFNPSRRGSLQRQDAYRTQHSREDPPVLPKQIESSFPFVNPLKDKSESSQLKVRDDFSIGRSISGEESVFEFVELSNYEPGTVTPPGSYTSSPRDSPVQCRRSSLAKDIMKVALNKSLLEQHTEKVDNASTDSDENQNLIDHCDKNENDKATKSKAEYIDTYSPVLNSPAKDSTKENGASTPKSSITKKQIKRQIAGIRCNSAPTSCMLKPGKSSKEQRSVVRFTQSEHAKSTEDLRVIITPTSPSKGDISAPHPSTHRVRYTVTPGYRRRVMSTGALTENATHFPSYATNIHTTSNHPHPHYPAKPKTSEGAILRRQRSLSANSVYSMVSYDYHRTTCNIPGPHSIDVHNAYSVTAGPHSSVISLLGTPPNPKSSVVQYQQGTAWYHIPGQYPPDGHYIPIKPNQIRLRSNLTRKNDALNTCIEIRRSWPIIQGCGDQSQPQQNDMSHSASWS